MISSMSTPTIHVVVVDAAGVRQVFEVGLVDLDCGCGSIDIRPGKPAFCRGFDHGVLTLDEGGKITTLDVTHGMASLEGDAIHVVCEQAATTLPEASISPEAIPCPAQPPASITHKIQTEQNI